MNEKFTKFLINSIHEKKIPHAFLIETNDMDAIVDEIYNIFLENDLINKTKLQNSSDVLMIYPDENSIKKDQVLYIQQFLNTKSISGKYKMYFMFDAQLMRDNACNKLLKVLEEPGENAIAFLLTNDLGLILPTITSRCESFKNYYEIADEEELVILANKFSTVMKENNYEQFLLLKPELLALERSSMMKFFNIYKKILFSSLTPENSKYIAIKYKLLDNISDLLKAYVGIELVLDRMFIELRDK